MVKIITITKFSLVPYIHIVKVTNTLSEVAKKTFKSNWNYYVTLEYGWLLWHRKAI